MRQVAIGGIALALWAVLHLEARAESGSELFKKNCQTCHSIEKDAPARRGRRFMVSSGARPGLSRVSDFRTA